MNADLTTVTDLDASNGLGPLLDRVVAGEELVITRRGEPVARLVPVDRHAADAADAALATFRAVRATLARAGRTASREDVRAWKGEGRP